MRRTLIAEGVGTFVLVFAGTSAIVLNVRTGDLGDLGVALVFGLAVAAMVQSFVRVSGAHLNPAVTFGMWLAGGMAGRRALAYTVAQLTGAVSASLLVRAVFGMTAHLGATLPRTDVVPALLFEAIATLILVEVVLTAADNGASPAEAALLIGAALFLDALIAGPMSGASMNPARSFGPALVGGIWRGQWVYWVGPAIGAVCAVGLRSLVGAHTTVLRVRRAGRPLPRPGGQAP